jgi:hypothetical protein
MLASFGLSKSARTADALLREEGALKLRSFGWLWFTPFLFCLPLSGCGGRKVTAPAYSVLPPDSPEKVLEGELKGILFRRSGEPAAGLEITLSDGILVTKTDAQGEFSIPVTHLTSQMMKLRVRDSQRLVASEVKLPENMLSVLNKGRVEVGKQLLLSELSAKRSSGFFAVTNPATVPVPVVFEQALGLQIPENRVVTATAADTNGSERKQLLLSYPVPLAMKVNEKKIGFWTRVENASTVSAVRLKWLNMFSEDAQVRIAFARSEGELTAWNGTAQGAPQWSGAGESAHLVTDFSACTEAASTSATEGPLTSADDTRCGFERTAFPFSEGVDVYLRVVGESADEIRFSPVFKIAVSNAAPTLSLLPGRSTPTNTALLNVPVTVSDADSGLECGMALDIVSSNTALLLDSNILIGGTVPNCTASFFPEDDFSGVSQITVRASDGSLHASVGFRLTVGEWAQEAFIKAPNTSQTDETEGDVFGSVVALSGNTLAVGAPREDSNVNVVTNGATASEDQSAANSGAVYVYIRSGNFWLQQAYIKASNANSGDLFGAAVALSGDVLAVSSPHEDSSATIVTNGLGSSIDNSLSDSGAVYIYRRTEGTWSQEAFIKAANSDVGDLFGASLALNENTIAVGVPFEDSSLTTLASGTDDDLLPNSGAVFVYHRSESGWALEAYLKAVNADGFDPASNPSRNEKSDEFGRSVALWDDTLAVGAVGEDSSDTVITNGTSAAIDNLNTDSGAVYVYRRTDSLWAQEAYLKAVNNRSPKVLYGDAVSLAADTLAVGALNENANESTITNGTSASDDVNRWESGAVYVYRRNGSTWAQEAYIKAANGDEYDHFGCAVSLSATFLAVGAKDESANQSIIMTGEIASSDNNASKSGAVYIYHRSGAVWRQDSYVKSVNVGPDDFFGTSVSISDYTLAVGAPGEDSNQTTILNGPMASSDNSSTESGAVYIYRKL